MPEEFEARIVLALKDHGGPPELAPQLVALAEQMELTDFVEDWIMFHVEPEWSAMQFRTWGEKYSITRNALLKAKEGL